MYFVSLRFGLFLRDLSSFQILLPAIFYFRLSRKTQILRNLNKILLINCFSVISSGILYGWKHNANILLKERYFCLRTTFSNSSQDCKSFENSKKISFQLEREYCLNSFDETSTMKLWVIWFICEMYHLHIIQSLTWYIRSRAMFLFLFTWWCSRLWWSFIASSQSKARKIMYKINLIKKKKEKEKRVDFPNHYKLSVQCRVSNRISLWAYKHTLSH